MPLGSEVDSLDGAKRIQQSAKIVEMDQRTAIARQLFRDRVAVAFLEKVSDPMEASRFCFLASPEKVRPLFR